MKTLLPEVQATLENTLTKLGYVNARRLLRSAHPVSSQLNEEAIRFTTGYYENNLENTYVSFLIDREDFNGNWRVRAIAAQNFKMISDGEKPAVQFARSWDVKNGDLPGIGILHDEIEAELKAVKAKEYLATYPELEKQMTTLGFSKDEHRIEIKQKGNRMLGFEIHEKILHPKTPGYDTLIFALNSFQADQTPGSLIDHIGVFIMHKDHRYNKYYLDPIRAKTFLREREPLPSKKLILEMLDLELAPSLAAQQCLPNGPGVSGEHVDANILIHDSAPPVNDLQQLPEGKLREAAQLYSAVSNSQQPDQLNRRKKT